MPLPKIDVPLFEIEVPSTGKKLTCRPFLVKEEKILLMAQQSDDDRERILAIKQIIVNCVQDKGFDPEQLTTFDVDYMFIRLRARSVDNTVSLVYKDFEDNKEYSFDINLEDVKIVKQDGHSNKIEINNDIGIIMKYPTVAALSAIPEDATEDEIVEALLIDCVDKVYDSENVYEVKDEPREEVIRFMESLRIDVRAKIKNFFGSMPKMQYVIEYKNTLGTERRIELNTLKDFFTWG